MLGVHFRIRLNVFWMMLGKCFFAFIFLFDSLTEFPLNEVKRVFMLSYLIRWLNFLEMNLGVCSLPVLFIWLIVVVKANVCVKTLHIYYSDEIKQHIPSRNNFSGKGMNRQGNHNYKMETNVENAEKWQILDNIGSHIKHRITKMNNTQVTK